MTDTETGDRTDGPIGEPDPGSTDPEFEAGATPEPVETVVFRADSRYHLCDRKNPAAWIASDLTVSVDDMR